MRFGLKLLLSCCLFLAAGGAWAQINDINSAINKAGRQRMLSQRMAKAYFLLGMNIEAERAHKILDTSMALFDRQEVELKNYAPTPEIKDTYQKLEKSWIAYKDALLGSKPNPASGKRVLELSDEVLGLAHQGTQQLEKYSNSVAGHLVNVAGRQRMLSQRVAKFYLARAWNIGSSASDVEVGKARKDFVNGLRELTEAPSDTQQIKDGLGLVGQQWFFLENSLGQLGSSDKRAAATIATTSERILEEMEGVVGLYEKLPSR